MEINKIINNPKLLTNNDDKKVILDLVKKKGTMLQYASDRLKNDIEIAKCAISNNYVALKYASDNLKNNKELVLLALNKNGLALEFVGKDLEKDYEVLLYAVCKNGLSLKFINNQYLTEELIFLAILQNPNALNLIDEINNKSLALSIANITSNIVNHLSIDLLFDKEFMLQLVENNPSCLKRIKNKEIALYILDKHNEYIKYMSEKLMQTDTVYEVVQVLMSKLTSENEELKSINRSLSNENERLKNKMTLDKIRRMKL